MRVFVAGASGALGSRLVPQLIDAGHEVIGTHNSPAGAEPLRTLGAKPVRLDLRDARAVRKAVLETEPEAIVHEATALANAKWGRSFDKAFATTNELRTKRIDALLAAAREAGVRRFVAQSFASYRSAREGGPVKTEDDPLDPTPPANARQSFAAMAYLEQAVTDFGGIVLRVFYGAANDGLIEPVRKRQYPIVGEGGGITSWIHLEDAAAATVLALEKDGPGDLQHRRRRAGAGAGLAARVRARRGREAAPALPDLAGAADRRRGRGRDEYRGPRRPQREGQARAGLDAAPSQLAHGVPGCLLGTYRGRRTEASRGPTDKPFAELARRTRRDEGVPLRITRDTLILGEGPLVPSREPGEAANAISGRDRAKESAAPRGGQRKDPALAAILGVELGGLEPPTSWVRSNDGRARRDTSGHRDAANRRFRPSRGAARVPSMANELFALSSRATDAQPTITGGVHDR